MESESDVVVVGQPDSIYKFENDLFEPPKPAAKPEDLFAPEGFVPHWDETVTDEQYHADKTCVGSGQLRKLLDSPKAFYSEFFQGTESEEEEKEVFRLGKLIHKAVLEGSEFKDNYLIMPDFGDQRVKVNKDAKAKWFLERPAGKLIVTKKDLDMILGIVNSIMEHPQGPDLLREGKPEVAGYYVDEETGIKLRIKPDFLAFNVYSFLDLKSTRSSKKKRFMADVYGDKRYDIQLYMYAVGIKKITGKWPELITLIAVEKTPPYECAIYYFEMPHFIQAETDYKKSAAQVVQLH